MASISFIQANGAARKIEAVPGATLMRVAIANDVAGIVGECGGNRVCATCHVYIEDGGHLPPVSEDEDALLDGVTAERRPSSRLSCQIIISEALDGLVVELPERQSRP
jgi:ferredoxin, 2Fe-2S